MQDEGGTAAGSVRGVSERGLTKEVSLFGRAPG